MEVYLMDTIKSQDEVCFLIATLLDDIQMSHVEIFNTRSRNLTLKKVLNRVRREGIAFVTKTMPKLAKAFDKALAGDTPLNSAPLGFKSQKGSKLPMFMGELFNEVLDSSGSLLLQPCEKCVRSLRQFLLAFAKYELPYTADQELAVVTKFVKTESELELSDRVLGSIRELVPETNSYRKGIHLFPWEIVREARILLERVFRDFDPRDIFPRHGPGAVATKQRLWDKYLWSNVSSSITDLYPFDEYFCSSLGHVCDIYRSGFPDGCESHPARVILVPKDSRGPRLISCEPVDFQWIQQGLSRAIVRHVESHPLTRENVRFTDQGPNGMAALAGSRTTKHATLDLNEASDRVSLELVRLLFPERILPYLEGCRTSATILPDGTKLPLRKYAPMGSALCFPILALTVWSLLSAGIVDANLQQEIYVYGDDVIVPTHYASYAIERLESFGLKINRDKSCIRGLFRESCGVDAFNGCNVTPVRFRTVWSTSPGPDIYSSWIAYANSFYDRGYYSTYDKIVSMLCAVYGDIPSDSDVPLSLSLREPSSERPLRSRYNKHLQKVQYYIWTIRSPSVRRRIDGWSMLLRYFTEAGRAQQSTCHQKDHDTDPIKDLSLWDLRTPVEDVPCFSVEQYTKRGTSMLVRRWR